MTGLIKIIGNVNKSLAIANAINKNFLFLW